MNKTHALNCYYIQIGSTVDSLSMGQAAEYRLSHNMHYRSHLTDPKLQLQLLFGLSRPGAEMPRNESQATPRLSLELSGA